jgi:hypothetical protein
MSGARRMRALDAFMVAYIAPWQSRPDRADLGQVNVARRHEAAAAQQSATPGEERRLKEMTMNAKNAVTTLPPRSAESVDSVKTAKAVQPTRLLPFGLLVLLLVLGTVVIVAFGQTRPSSQTHEGPRTSTQQQICVRGGQDACYQTISADQQAGAQQVCIRVGRDSCYLTISADPQTSSQQQTCVPVGQDACYELVSSR